MFPLQTEDNKVWAAALICDTLNTSEDAVDSSTFRDFLVTRNGDDKSYKIAVEIFSTTFMGIVASRLAKAANDSMRERLSKLFGQGGVGNFFEFESHDAMLRADRESVYTCYCPSDTDEIGWL